MPSLKGSLDSNYGVNLGTIAVSSFLDRLMPSSKRSHDPNYGVYLGTITVSSFLDHLMPEKGWPDPKYGVNLGTMLEPHLRIGQIE